MKVFDGLPIISFDTIEQWEKWLAKNHDGSPGVWLRLQKKDSKQVSVSYAEALDVALCYGWIDGQKNSFDKHSWIQRFTRRRLRSSWSKRNTDHVKRLIKTGQMKPAGLFEVNAAKKDGRWKASYDSPSKATIPADFLKELTKSKKSLAFFNTLNKSNRYSIIYRLQTAKNPETRERRMRLILEMMKKGEKFA
ncbi:MAG: YdeI/OmpD-associated family protein [Bdellovibrionia bacterium]